MEKDAKFCTACGAEVEIVNADEEKTDLSTSMTDIALELSKTVLEKVEGDNHSTHFEEIRNAQPTQVETPVRSATPGTPQASTHSGSAGASTPAHANKMKRDSVSVREAAKRQAQVGETATEIPAQAENAPVTEQAPLQTENAPITEQVPQQTKQTPATRRASAPMTQAAPVQTPASVPVSADAPVVQPPVGHAPVGGGVATKIGNKIIDTTTDVIKEGGKKLSVGKTIAIWAAVVAFVIGAATACLSFFVSAPDDTVTTLVESVEELDYEKMLGCFDSKTERQIRAVLGITGDLFGSFTGISLDLEDLMDLAPSLAPYLEVPDLGIANAETVLYADCSKNKIMQYCIAANNGESIPTGYLADNEIVNFLMEYKISLPGLENLIAKTAIVKVTLKNGEVGYFPLINEGWGDWRIPMMDMVEDLS